MWDTTGQFPSTGCQFLNSVPSDRWQNEDVHENTMFTVTSATTLLGPEVGLLWICQPKWKIHQNRLPMCLGVANTEVGYNKTAHESKIQWSFKCHLTLTNNVCNDELTGDLVAGYKQSCRNIYRSDIKLLVTSYSSDAFMFPCLILTITSNRKSALCAIPHC